MKKKIVRLNESDITNMVNKIIKEDSLPTNESLEDNLLNLLVESTIKEEGGVETEKSDDPRDVDKFLQLADKYLFQKFSKYAEKIDTPREKAKLIAALAKKWGVDAGELGKVKAVLNNESVKSKKNSISERSIFNRKKKQLDLDSNKSYTESELFDYMKKKYGIDNRQININKGRRQFSTMLSSLLDRGSSTSIKKAAGELHHIMNLNESSKKKAKQLAEVGGYDDPNIMSQHAGTSMAILKDVLRGIVMTTSGMSQLLNNGSKYDIMEATSSLVDSLEEAISLLKKVNTDFTEDNMVAQSKGLIISLQKYIRKLRVLGTSGHGFDETDFKTAIADASLEMNPKLMGFLEAIRETDKRFTTRFQGRDRGEYNQGDEFFN